MEIYIARRYFKMSAQEWDDLPWWETHALVEGLELEGILKGNGSKQQSSTTSQGGGGMDLTKTSGGIPQGFGYRRAG